MAVTTQSLTFWQTSNYSYPGFDKTVEIPDGLGGTIGITYHAIDFEERNWKTPPYSNVPMEISDFLSGELEENFSIANHELKSLSHKFGIPDIKDKSSEVIFSITFDFSHYKASVAGSKLSDGATCQDTYIAFSHFQNGFDKNLETVITITGESIDGSSLDLKDWKLSNSGAFSKVCNTKIFLDKVNQTLSGKNTAGQQELTAGSPELIESLGYCVATGLLQLPSTQRYKTLTFSYRVLAVDRKVSSEDFQHILLASNTTSIPAVTPSVSEKSPQKVENKAEITSQKVTEIPDESPSLTPTSQEKVELKPQPQVTQLGSSISSVLQTNTSQLKPLLSSSSLAGSPAPLPPVFLPFLGWLLGNSFHSQRYFAPSSVRLNIECAGVWLKVTEQVSGASYLTGVGSNHIRWGIPNAGSYQSGYRFDGVSSTTAVIGRSYFLLGSFTHYNFPIFYSITSVTLRLNLTINNTPISFSFLIHHQETPNQGGNGNVDIVSFVNDTSQEVVIIQGKSYRLKLGFYQQGQVVTQIWTPENQLNTVQLCGVFLDAK